MKDQQMSYLDYELLVRRARLERSVALAGYIASAISAAVFGVRRVIDAIKPNPSGSKDRTGAAAEGALQARAHR